MPVFFQDSRQYSKALRSTLLTIPRPYLVLRTRFRISWRSLSGRARLDFRPLPCLRRLFSVRLILLPQMLGLAVAEFHHHQRILQPNSRLSLAPMLHLVVVPSCLPRFAQSDLLGREEVFQFKGTYLTRSKRGTLSKWRNIQQKHYRASARVKAKSPFT